MSRKKTTKKNTHPTIADLDALAVAYAEKEPKVTQQALFGDIALQSAAGTMRQQKDKRGFRGQFKFWLSANKPDELALGQELNALKSVRKYTATIRDALRLFFDLKNGNTAVLGELFPGIIASLSTQQQRPASDDFDRLLHEIHGLKQHLSPAPMTPFTEPQRQRDDTQLVTVGAGGKKSSQEIANNFLNGMSGFFD